MHKIKTKLVYALLLQRKTDQPPAVRSHEVNRNRGCHLRRNDKVAGASRIILIHENEDTASASFCQNVLNRSNVVSPSSASLCNPGLRYPNPGVD
jgi:hypothetical protein